MIEATFTEIFADIWAFIVDILKIAVMIGGVGVSFLLIAFLIVAAIIIISWIENGFPVGKRFKEWWKGY